MVRVSKGINDSDAKKGMKMELVMNMGKNELAFTQGNKHGLRLVKGNKDNLTSTASFVTDFEDIVQTELQKSLFCIDLINQDITHHQKELRFQLKILKDLWRLVPPSKDREERAVKIMNKIAVSRQAIVDCEERLFVITQRILVLEEQVAVLS
jgi:3-deoxy-D-arabino-heptulosonate 7-phosphate (DAHP) synthase